MHERSILAIILIASSLSLPAIGQAATEGQDDLLSRGLHERVFQLEDGAAIRYSLAVPTLEPDDTVPLVLALHYGGEVTPYYSMGYLRLLAGPGFAVLSPIIIAPDCPGRGWTDPESERAVLALLDHALENWPVDPKRVVVTGFSMGGGGTWFMAGKHPERFSAAVPVAGWPAAKLDGSVPIYAVHGGRDEVVALEPTTKAIAELREKGATAELVVIEGLTHYQTESYVAPLIDAAEWVRKRWADAPATIDQRSER